MSRAIDLSQLPTPRVVEPLDYEEILAEQLEDLAERYPYINVPAESDPAFKVLQVCAFREMLVRQRVNEAARAVMLSYAEREDLDNLGALFNVTRLQTDPGDPISIPPVPPSYESDNEFRRRILLSLEGLSTAGPEGAYIYHALSADGSVLDASATSPKPDDIKGLVMAVLANHNASDALIDAMNEALNNAKWPGEVDLTVLSREGDGTAPVELLEAVDAAVSAEHVRPLTDYVTVQSAEILLYTIEATLYFYPGPDSQVVLAEALAMAQAYADAQHRLGLDITLSGLYAALHRPGVQRVELISPAATIEVSRQQAAFCTSITLTDGGVHE
ncbi:baseplate assembly protein [Billgrantia desiderata]|uniref:baseplate assembly protein n=1 Tax=Billgrantia desiderata TaxID=52021 RepID=UPI00089E3DB4|nr:baseplate J/gp47 family protein [Halomonas desiderata]SEG44063.1 Phage-related baseplate assembly protein [Halomonas desiderata]